MIVGLDKSPVKFKRFRVKLDDGRHFDFGLDGGKTFIDTGDEKLKANYLKRHLANATERKLITNLVPSPALFSAILLWGRYTDIHKNIDYLNGLWKKKKSI